MPPKGTLILLPHKSILRKDGMTYKKKKKKLMFQEPLEEEEPPRLAAPKRLSDTVREINDLEQDNFRQVWQAVSSKKLNQAARKLQKFARKHMLCWILTNDKRTDLYEELEYIQERLQGDLERLEWEKEDMQQEAQLQVQAELENAPPEEYSRVKRDLTTIKELQAEIRALKADNQRMRTSRHSLKKENKQYMYDLKEKLPAVEMSKERLQNLKDNHRAIRANHDQYAPNVQMWQDSVAQMDAQVQLCQAQGHAYRDACLDILEQVQTRYPKKRVLDPMVEIFQQDFAPHHPVPEIKIVMDNSLKGSSSHRRSSTRRRSVKKKSPIRKAQPPRRNTVCAAEVERNTNRWKESNNIPLPEETGDKKAADNTNIPETMESANSAIMEGEESSRNDYYKAAAAAVNDNCKAAAAAVVVEEADVTESDFTETQHDFEDFSSSVHFEEEGPIITQAKTIHGEGKESRKLNPEKKLKKKHSKKDLKSKKEKRKDMPKKRKSKKEKKKDVPVQEEPSTAELTETDAEETLTETIPVEASL